MANIIEITDLTAPQLAVYTQLTHAQLRNRRSPEQGVFIAESSKVIACALAAGCRPISLLMEHRQLSSLESTILEQCRDIPIYTAQREILAQLTGYELTRGFLCAMIRPSLPSAEEICQRARRIAVLENITDPSNVGALFRSAAALGMDGIFVTPSCCDPLYRRSVRVSMGAVFQIPWTQIGETSSSWPHAGLALLKQFGFQTAAMALSDHSISIEDPHFLQAEKLAVILGNEGNGLSPATIKACDYTVRIPMSHGVDSLNVATAGAIVFWQIRPRT